jgi:hypothetical protein
MNLNVAHGKIVWRSVFDVRRPGLASILDAEY